MKATLSSRSSLFSLKGIDQCHEKVNEIVKGDGLAVGLLKDDDKLHR